MFFTRQTDIKSFILSQLFVRDWSRSREASECRDCPSVLNSCVEGLCLHQTVVMSVSYASFAYEWSTFAGKCTIGLIGLIGILLYTHQDKLLYIPNPPGFPQKPSDNPIPFQSPGDWTVQGKRAVSSANSIPFEEEHLSTSDGKLIHTWLMLQADSMNVPTLIYFHGNAG
jgi:hypothetical protein